MRELKDLKSENTYNCDLKVMTEDGSKNLMLVPIVPGDLLALWVNPYVL